MKWKDKVFISIQQPIVKPRIHIYIYILPRTYVLMITIMIVLYVDFH